MNRKLNSKDLSFVVQGPIDSKTKLVLINLRKNFNNAEIILSTWKESNLEGLTFDKLVQSDDPGALIAKDGYVNNVNRQILSSQNGINFAEREIVVKIRTDILFYNNKILSILENSDLNKIIIANHTSINPQKKPILFQLCDWIYAGKKENLKVFFDTPFITDSENNFFSNVNLPNRKFNPEQWLTFNYLNRNEEVFHFPHGFYYSIESVTEILKLYRNYFSVKNQFSLGFINTKYKFYEFDLENIYTNIEWNNIKGKIDFERILYKFIIFSKK